MFRTTKELLDALRNPLPRRIGIDGIDGVRKTTIATFIADELRAEVVSLDDYLQKNQGGYIDFIRYDLLTERLQSIDRVVVEGVCLLQVLDRARFSIDCLVYIKRYHLNRWADERELTVRPDEVNAFIAKERQLAAMLSGEPDGAEPSLADEVIRYHSAYKPHHRACFTYRWDSD